MSLGAVDENIQRAINAFSGRYSFSKREKDVLTLLVQSVLTPDEISQRLNISENTVRVHFQNIFKRSQTSSKAEVLSKFSEFVVTQGLQREAYECSKRLKILMVDDDPQYKQLVERALKKVAGQQTHFTDVAGGGELIEYLRNMLNHSESVEEVPDLIFLDINMPQMDGFETLKSLKSDPKMNKIPIILFTTSNRQSDIEKLYELGGNSFIQKPASYHELVEKMRDVIHYWGHVSGLSC